ncbi:MAG: cadmium-translocating P-type ATPase [Clostridiales bacterium]|nr:cadmium-translocating P-type ATPase [Clostridiales bacterium]
MVGKQIKFQLDGLDCGNCANKIEEKINSLVEVEEASVNFSLGIVNIELKSNISKDEIKKKIQDIVNEIEPDVLVKEYNKEKIGERDYHEEKLVLRLKGLDCANCAQKIESKISQLENVEKAEINFSIEKLSVKLKTKNKNETINEIKNIVKEIEPDIIVEKYNKNTEEEERLIKLPIILGIILFIVAMVVGEDNFYTPFILLGSYLLVGGKVIISAVRNLINGEIFDENFLMTIATLGAFAIKEYPEAVAVMVFYEIGEIFQGYAVGKSRKSISSLMDIKADYANVVKDNKEIKVSPEEVSINDVIVIKPGERVPLDCIIIEGQCSTDTSALTGESLPVSKKVSDELLAGSINLDKVIKAKVTKEYGESTVARILELVENASSKKAKTEKFITKFSKYYTPTVVALAVVLAIVPPLIIKDALFSDWIYRSLIFLVVSCPCALVISIPLGLFAGIGGASKKGILVKGGNYLEAIKEVDTVVFDKTGTLTKGNFKVTEINNINIDKEELIKIAAYGESFSNHPIAKSILSEYKNSVDKTLISDYEEIGGNGIKVKIEGKEVLLGNNRLMDDNSIDYNKVESVGTIINIAINKEYKGYIVISDEIKADSKKAIKGLKENGIKKIVMLTGDNKKVADKIGSELGIDEVYSELLPGDKVNNIEKIIESSNGKVAFVGDGINDAPVLARADIGIAMGGIGSDAAIEAADIVLMKDEPSSLVDAIKIGKKVNSILWGNIIFSLGVKVLVLLLATVGIANIWGGVFADVGVTLIAVFNSMRGLNIH